MEIEKFPDRIVYFSGFDSKIDLTGGVVSYILKQNSKSFADMEDSFITVSHDYTIPLFSTPNRVF